MAKKYLIGLSKKNIVSNGTKRHRVMTMNGVQSMISEKKISGMFYTKKEIL